MAFARVVGTIRSHAADLLVSWNLVEQIGQHRCISGVAARDLDCSDFQRLLINADVDLAPDAPFAAAMLAGVPLAFPFDLDAGAIDKQVQRALRATIRDVDRKRPLASADGAEVRNVPIEARQPQEAFHKARRLPKRHSEYHFHGQARLDGMNRLQRTYADNVLSKTPIGPRLPNAIYDVSKSVSDRYQTRRPRGPPYVIYGPSQFVTIQDRPANAMVVSVQSRILLSMPHGRGSHGTARPVLWVYVPCVLLDS
jgi:hypothetical protein